MTLVSLGDRRDAYKQGYLLLSTTHTRFCDLPQRMYLLQIII